jgi:sterol desaturase/sphingolipid hydroxylase (fatty acid hydroxylase superfamily)
MADIKINYSKEPIRLFKSDFLEFFTHIHPAVVLIIWLPVAIYFFIDAVNRHQAGASYAYIPLGFVLGLFLWTFTEYAIHRFVFHFPPRSPWQERVSFLFHGVHHAQPQMKTRLVMPPVVSLPLALISYGLFYLVAGVLLGALNWVSVIFSGFIIGYLAYDMIHYATHHFPMRRGIGKFLKRYHMQHHAKTPNQRYGVSSPLWDIVFRTMPAK